jgi:hypothetical protein
MPNMSSAPAHESYPLMPSEDSADSTDSTDSSYTPKKYSMGVDGVSNDSAKCHPSDRCCCRLFHVRTAAVLIALFELVCIIYQSFSVSWSYAKTGDEHAFSFSITLFSFALAFIAVVLLIVGVKKGSPYFLVPHLLMQFAIIVSTALLSVYLALLLIGGTSIKVDAILYEDSPRGELGLAQSTRYEALRATTLLNGLNAVLISLLITSLFFFAFQVWFFVVVNKCYGYLQRISLEKPSQNGTPPASVQDNNHGKV